MPLPIPPDSSSLTAPNFGHSYRHEHTPSIPHFPLPPSSPPPSAVDILPPSASRPRRALVSVVLQPHRQRQRQTRRHHPDPRHWRRRLQHQTPSSRSSATPFPIPPAPPSSRHSSSKASPPVKLFLARFADHPRLGARESSAAFTPPSRQKTPPCLRRSPQKHVRPYDKIPLANLSPALDVFAAGQYKPALPLVRELAAKSSPTQITAVYKLADVGDLSDLPFLWSCVKDPDALPQLRIAAANSLSSLGTFDESQKILAYARSLSARLHCAGAPAAAKTT